MLATHLQQQVVVVVLVEGEADVRGEIEGLPTHRPHSHEHTTGAQQAVERTLGELAPSGPGNRKGRGGRRGRRGRTGGRGRAVV